MKAVLSKLEGRRVSIRILRVQRERTAPQNAYLWGCVYPLLAEAIGYDVEELHEACKLRFLRDRENEREDLPRVRSTAKLSTAEFSEYVETVRRLAAELGVNIPDPGAWE